MSARPDIDEELLDAALTWHFALESDDADWAAYEVWLEADPRHRIAMNEIALTDRIASERATDVARIEAIQPVQVAQPSIPRRRWLIGSVAAALAAAVALPTLWPSDTIYSTGQAQGRQIAIGEGVQVNLAPSSKLIAEGGDPTKLELAEGEAYFAVAHDPSRVLAIKAGNVSVTDIGTTFAMNLAPQTVTVAVAEGHVSVVPNSGEATRLDAGQQLLARRDGQMPRVSKITAGDVGSWRAGRLVYDQVPLSAVAADISRYSGKKISVDPAIADREFSGVLVIGDGSNMLATLAEIMALAYEDQGAGARLYSAASR